MRWLIRGPSPKRSLRVVSDLGNEDHEVRSESSDRRSRATKPVHSITISNDGPRDEIAEIVKFGFPHPLPWTHRGKVLSWNDGRIQESFHGVIED